VTTRKRARMPKSRGEYGFSVPEAGAMIGLSVNSSYAAAKKQQIPNVEMNGLRIVPRAIWLRMLGVEAKPSDDTAGEKA